MFIVTFIHWLLVASRPTRPNIETFRPRVTLLEGRAMPDISPATATPLPDYIVYREYYEMTQFDYTIETTTVTHQTPPPLSYGQSSSSNYPMPGDSTQAIQLLPYIPSEEDDSNPTATTLPYIPGDEADGGVDLYRSPVVRPPLPRTSDGYSPYGPGQGPSWRSRPISPPNTNGVLPGITDMPSSGGYMRGGIWYLPGGVPALDFRTPQEQRANETEDERFQRELRESQAAWKESHRLPDGVVEYKPSDELPKEF